MHRESEPVIAGKGLDIESRIATGSLVQSQMAKRCSELKVKEKIREDQQSGTAVDNHAGREIKPFSYSKRQR